MHFVMKFNIQVNMTIGNLAKLLIYMVSAMSQLFILCWKGDRLIESVSKIFLSIIIALIFVKISAFNHRIYIV